MSISIDVDTATRAIDGQYTVNQVTPVPGGTRVTITFDVPDRARPTKDGKERTYAVSTFVQWQNGRVAALSNAAGQPLGFTFSAGFKVS